MNNLLRTLTESQVKPAADLRLLLTAVKEGRKQSYDTKLTDPFYDSLEGLLMDLKTITIDNHDAEAFLKPVSKAEVPDYHEVIQHPMDFQTMLKKVKQKSYKSKREFKDDLDLIWANCLMYNAAENHPLRPCVKRLKIKAERLLKHITDRKERADPPIPANLPSSSSAGAGPSRPRLNGKTNGYTNGHAASPSSSTSSSYTSPPLSTNHNHSHYGNSTSSHSSFSKPSSSSITIPPRARPKPRLAPPVRGRGGQVLQHAPFADMPAIVRTPEGMALFRELDGTAAGVDVGGAGAGKVARALKELVPELESDVDADGEEDGDAMMVVDGAAAGDKRKLNGLSSDRRPRKKARFSEDEENDKEDGRGKVREEGEEVSHLWWGAVQSDALLGCGLPGIPFGPSSSKPSRAKKEKEKAKNKEKERASSRNIKAKRKPPPAPAPSATAPPVNQKSLLAQMNGNIKTMRRLRGTHARFAALNDAPVLAEDEELDGGVFVGGGAGGGGGGNPGGGGGNAGVGGGVGAALVGGDEEVDDRIDEAPWIVGRDRGGVQGVGIGKGMGKAKTKKKKTSGVGGIEIGVQNASDCLHWSTEKILEHAGFQGTSAVALGVLSDVMAEYLQNVGRMMRFLSDKFGKAMTPEEIILHTLFESGSSKVQDLERYISDDIERYGARLSELEKKLVGAYRETTAGEVLEDEGLFEEEDDEEIGALAMGDFADLLGEDDYLGLRASGIADELGVATLSIPKKLMRSKKMNKPTATKPTEPPPPFPPPPPLIPFKAGKVDDQIGLLKAFYQNRFAQLSASLAPPAAAPPPVFLPPGPGGVKNNGVLMQGAVPQTFGGVPLTVPPPAQQSSINPDLVLPDELPGSAQMKMGPIGQIVKGGAASGGAKKKAKTGAEGGAAAGGGGPAGLGGAGGQGQGQRLASAQPSPKKKKANMGVGSGNGRKKKADGPASATPGMGYGSGQGQGGAAAMLPAVVFASA